ncbi:AraC family transcriptional regulator [Roseateles sp. DAIF2]|uniref:AraC family transcriptional regulator n=1 Tax=Roseateles sp. DAIF2 TaxID=2714952 RepID=UPI0018A2B8C3|nr:AraC family transcriptional regulator [Roseateles sp. DAIF2]QPF76172.1 AraC family transcriptional regulator [Roseateles sp. DAIF2]
MTELPWAALPPGPAAPHYELDQPCLAYADQAVLLAEFARSRGLAEALPAETPPLISPRRLLALLAPLQERGGPDAAFVIGRHWLPGHYGLASQALQEAPDLVEVLRLLCALAGRLTPLLTPRLLLDERELILVWTEACGLPPGQRGFLVDLHMSAVAGLADWLGGQRLPWRFSFNRTAPRDLAQHAVHLGESLAFGCQADAMRLDLAWARRPWPTRAGGRAAAALARGADPQAGRRGLLAALHDRLLPRLDQAPTLDELAAGFGMSPATLKRRLAQHGTHYQAELDQLRALVALYLLRLRGQPNEAVAEALGFFDGANFRRFFKRWTGLRPSALGR